MVCFILAFTAVLNGCKKKELLKYDASVTKKNDKIYSGAAFLSGLPNQLSNIDAYNALSKEEKLFYLIITNALENNMGINPIAGNNSMSLISVNFDFAELHLTQLMPGGGNSPDPTGPSVLPDFLQIIEYPYGLSGVPSFSLDYTDGNSFRSYDQLIPIVKHFYQLYWENKNSYTHDGMAGMGKPLYFFLTKNAAASNPFYSIFLGQESYPDHSPGLFNVYALELAQMKVDEANTESNMTHLRERSIGCQADRQKYKEATNLPQFLVNITPCAIVKGY